MPANVLSATAARAAAGIISPHSCYNIRPWSWLIIGSLKSLNYINDVLFLLAQRAKSTLWRLTKLTQIDEEYSPATTSNKRIMTRECASSYADWHQGDVKWRRVLGLTKNTHPRRPLMSALWHVSALCRTRTDIQASSNDEGYSSALRQIWVPFVSLHTVNADW